MNNNKITFMLVRGRLLFFRMLHEEFLVDNMKLFPNYAEIVRFFFPRGRATPYGDGTLIEASPELEAYKDQISRELELEPIDRPDWDFGHSHYEIHDVEHIANRLKDLYSTNPSQRDIKNILKHIPELKDYLEPLLETHQANAKIISNWLIKANLQA